jgi:hypothetical protein
LDACAERDADGITDPDAHSVFHAESHEDAPADTDAEALGETSEESRAAELVQETGSLLAAERFTASP